MYYTISIFCKDKNEPIILNIEEELKDEDLIKIQNMFTQTNIVRIKLEKEEILIRPSTILAIHIKNNLETIREI